MYVERSCNCFGYASVTIVTMSCALCCSKRARGFLAMYSRFYVIGRCALSIPAQSVRLSLTCSG